jgi:cell division septum initiation protein DivIVA
MDTGFDVALRGYDKRQVDERIRALVAELVAADNALAAAAQRISMLEDALSQVRHASDGEPAGDANFGARVEKIMKLAEDESREVRAQAEAAAGALLDQARAQAAEQRERAEQEIAAWRADANREAAEQDDALRRRSSELDTACQEAEREAERVRAQARAEAEQIRTSASAKAEELVRTATADAEMMTRAARAEADRLVAQARAEADRLIAAATDAATQRERSSAHELHQLTRLQEEINADLYRVKDVLDTLFGPGAAITGGTMLPKRRKDGPQPTHQANPV